MSSSVITQRARSVAGAALSRLTSKGSSNVSSMPAAASFARISPTVAPAGSAHGCRRARAGVPQGLQDRHAPMFVASAVGL